MHITANLFCIQIVHKTTAYKTFARSRVKPNMYKSPNQPNSAKYTMSFIDNAIKVATTQIRKYPHMKGNTAHIHKAQQAMARWSVERIRLEAYVKTHIPGYTPPWQTGRDSKNTSRALYLQLLIHDHENTVTITWEKSNDASFYGITRVHVPYTNVSKFNTGVVQSASNVTTPKAKNVLRQIWHTAGLVEKVNADGSIDFTFNVTAFAKKKAQRNHYKSDHCKRIAISKLID